MAARHNFRKLTIWKEGIELAKETYSITKIFPKSEIYSLTSQMQRAAVSISSNIAEGTAKVQIDILYNFWKILWVRRMNGKHNLL